MPYLRQISFTGIPASASFKIATIWLSVMRLLIVKLLCFSLKEILRASCIILRGSYNGYLFFGRNRILNTRVAVKFYYWGGEVDYHAEPNTLANIHSPNILEVHNAG